MTEPLVAAAEAPTTTEALPNLTGWQRRALVVLAHILTDHQGLPLLRWSIVPHGCGLVGEVPTASNAFEVGRAFAEWQAALGLAVRPVAADRLMATGLIGECRITLTATIPLKPRKTEKAT